jgi:hypothetical protein
MSTVAEIIDAVKQLSPVQKTELVLQLESVLMAPASESSVQGAAEGLSPEFTQRLIEHFHGAKRAALSQS